MPTFSPTRAFVVLITLAVAFGGLVGRVAYLQTAGRTAALRRAERQQHQTEPLAARRGCIYDRNGVLLAGTAEAGTVYADPAFLLDHYQTDGRSVIEMDDAVDRLAAVLHVDAGELSRKLSEHSTAHYLKLTDGVVDGQTAAEVAGLHLAGVGVAPTPQRYYPGGSLAAHLLGGVGRDGHGLEGLELEFDRQLAGVDGHQRVLKDARRRPVGVTDDDYVAPRHGRHLVLTIDSYIQGVAERQLAETCQHNGAKLGEVVVMDPRTGDVLALANWPTYDPAELDRTKPEVSRDRVVNYPYEPGSTIKPFIVGPSLAWGVTRDDDVFALGGSHYVTPYGRHITDVHGYEQLCLWDVLVKSSNIGMSMLGERLGNDRLHAALAAWQFGRRTGIDLPGENPGVLRPLARWSRSSTESVSQGYELTVTPIQLARAFCGYANGGRLVTPRLVLDAPEAAPRAIISPATAADVKRILADVPIRGTAAGTGTRSLEWNIFGKTGTAHISEGKAGYSPTRFNSSFLAGAPAEGPRLVIALVVHDPNKSIAHYGGWVAAPGASQILQQSLAYLQVPPSPDLPLPPDDVAAKLAVYSPKCYSRDPKDQPKVAE